MDLRDYDPDLLTIEPIDGRPVFEVVDLVERQEEIHSRLANLFHQYYENDQRADWTELFRYYLNF